MPKSAMLIFMATAWNKTMCKPANGIEKGRSLGEITAMLGLADCYKNGIGGKQDYDKAMIEYLHLAERT